MICRTSPKTPKPWVLSGSRVTYLTGLANTLLFLLTSCTTNTTNSLQSAVDKLAANRDVPSPGAIVDQDVRGDWAFVRTAGPAVAGYGEFVSVQTQQGRQWTILSFTTFEAAGNELTLRSIQVGGKLAKQKENSLDKALRDVATKKWNDYLGSQKLAVSKPKRPCAMTVVSFSTDATQEGRTQMLCNE